MVGTFIKLAKRVFFGNTKITMEEKIENVYWADRKISLKPMDMWWVWEMDSECMKKGTSVRREMQSTEEGKGSQRGA